MNADLSFKVKKLIPCTLGSTVSCAIPFLPPCVFSSKHPKVTEVFLPGLHHHLAACGLRSDHESCTTIGIRNNALPDWSAVSYWIPEHVFLSRTDDSLCMFCYRVFKECVRKQLDPFVQTPYQNQVCRNCPMRKKRRKITEILHRVKSNWSYTYY